MALVFLICRVIFGHVKESLGSSNVSFGLTIESLGQLIEFYSQANSFLEVLLSIEKLSVICRVSQLSVWVSVLRNLTYNGPAIK